jgi:hypothetical protein
LISQETLLRANNLVGIRKVPSYDCSVVWLKIKPEIFAADFACFLFNIALL